jgi:hypothetical protein
MSAWEAFCLGLSTSWRASTIAIVVHLLLSTLLFFITHGAWKFTVFILSQTLLLAPLNFLLVSWYMCSARVINGFQQYPCDLLDIVKLLQRRENRTTIRYNYSRVFAVWTFTMVMYLKCEEHLPVLILLPFSMVVLGTGARWFSDTIKLGNDERLLVVQ